MGIGLMEPWEDRQQKEKEAVKTEPISTEGE
jgi:hypothetical protein